jgi:hypothetical protein
MRGVHCYRRQTIPYTTRNQIQKESKMEVEKPDKCVIRGAVNDFMSLDTRNLTSNSEEIKSTSREIPRETQGPLDFLLG